MHHKMAPHKRARKKEPHTVCHRRLSSALLKAQSRAEIAVTVRHASRLFTSCEIPPAETKRVKCEMRRGNQPKWAPTLSLYLHGEHGELHQPPASRAAGPLRHGGRHGDGQGLCRHSTGAKRERRRREREMRTIGTASVGRGGFGCTPPRATQTMLPTCSHR